MPAIALRLACKVADLVVVQAADHDHVDLYGIEACAPGRVEPGQRVSKVASTGQHLESVGLERVEANIHALQASFLECGRVAGQ